MSLRPLFLALVLTGCVGDKAGNGADDSGDTGDNGTPDSGSPDSGSSDSGTTQCVDYAELVADCDAQIVRVDGGGDTWSDIDPDSATLEADLRTRIDDHGGVSYDGLWQAFLQTDVRSDGSIWDIYSDPGDGAPAYAYTPEQDQCGQYDSEGDCYNREHSFPQSWSDDGAPERSDLHHVFPVDGYVNGLRGSLPFGPVGQVRTTTTNGALRGVSGHCGYDDDVFEPVDAYKGDLARALLYVSVRYEGEDSDWGDSDATDGAHLEPWFSEVLLAWHILDPVSDKELFRNDAVEAIQGNRNPFVDRPELACRIAEW